MPPTATGTGVAIGGRAAEVFVELEGYQYLDPPAAVVERFTAGFAAQAEAAAIVDSVAAKTVVPDGGDATGGAVVVSIAIDESVGPLADGFREGVIASLAAEGAPEPIEIAGRTGTFVDVGDQQAIYVQDGTVVLFFLGTAGRAPLEQVAQTLVGMRG